MTKFSLSSTGFADLQSELYNLTNEELALEAASISSSLIQWTENHFVLDAKQTIYLKQINAQVIEFLTQQIHFAIKNRLPVYLNKSSEKFGDEQGKLIKPTSNLTATSADGSFMPGGELTIEISYTSPSKNLQDSFEHQEPAVMYEFEACLS